MNYEAVDMQWTNNHTVLHPCTDHEDFDGPDKAWAGAIERRLAAERQTAFRVHADRAGVTA